MIGKFYGLGVGPGDPELLTIKAINVLREVDVVVVPESKKEVGSVAMEIALPYLKSDIQIITLVFPMIRDTDAKTLIRNENALQIAQLLHTGKNVAFLTLGDPMLYSTYIYLLENLFSIGITPISVPGIYSFSAISNLLNLPLVKGDESLAVISDFDDFKWQALQIFKTIVCMKVSSYASDLYNQLKDSDTWSFALVTNAGKSTQTVSYNLNDLKNEVHYFTTVILTRKG